MDWCEQNRVHYIFGLSTNAVLAAQVFAKTDDVCASGVRPAIWMARDYTETRYAAKSCCISAASWHGSRRRGKVSMFATSRYQHQLRHCRVALRCPLVAHVKENPIAVQ